MKYPKTPESEREAVEYAAELERIHGSKFIPIRRKAPMDNKWVINFSAICEKEIDELLPEFEPVEINLP
jgi:hypothetical protein